MITRAVTSRILHLSFAHWAVALHRRARWFAALPGQLRVHQITCILATLLDDSIDDTFVWVRGCIGLSQALLPVRSNPEVDGR